MARAETESKNFVAKGIDFSKESWAEFKKVHKPTRQETIDMTLRVLLLIFVFAVFLGFADFVVGTVMRKILL